MRRRPGIRITSRCWPRCATCSTAPHRAARLNLHTTRASTSDTARAVDSQPGPESRSLWGKAVFALAHATRALAETEREARPDRGILAALRLIPAAASGCPDGALHVALQTRVERTLNVVAQVHGSRAAPAHHTQTVGDVLHLRLDHVDHRVVAKASVRSDHHEEIRKARHARAEIRFGPVA